MRQGVAVHFHQWLWRDRYSQLLLEIEMVASIPLSFGGVTRLHLQCQGTWLNKDVDEMRKIGKSGVQQIDCKSSRLGNVVDRDFGINVVDREIWDVGSTREIK